jgi:hypothetical protein
MELFQLFRKYMADYTAQYLATTTYLSPSLAEADSTSADQLIQLGAPLEIWYVMMAKDSGAIPPSYTTWITQDTTSSPVPAPIGAWVDKTIIYKFQIEG